MDKDSASAGPAKDPALTTTAANPGTPPPPPPQPSPPLPPPLSPPPLSAYHEFVASLPPGCESPPPEDWVPSAAFVEYFRDDSPSGSRFYYLLELLSDPSLSQYGRDFYEKHLDRILDAAPRM